MPRLPLANGRRRELLLATNGSREFERPRWNPNGRPDNDAGTDGIMLRALVADTREMFAEQLEYRELLLRMTARDLLIRYKQTVMGFAWAVFMPLVNTSVFSVIFTRVAPLDTGMPYPVFAYSGFLAWNFFASSLRFSVTSLTSNTNLVTKVYFPREIFPFSAVIVSVRGLSGRSDRAGRRCWFITASRQVSPFCFCQLS